MKTDLSQSVARIPVMLSESDIAALIHAISETSVAERPEPGTTTKLATALRRLDPHRESKQAWRELEAIRGR